MYNSVGLTVNEFRLGYDDMDDERIFCFGNLDTWRLMSLYKRADYFIHLGILSIDSEFEANKWPEPF